MRVDAFHAVLRVAMLCGLTAIHTAAAGASFVWSGNGDGVSWSDVRNWSPQRLPTWDDDVDLGQAATTNDVDDMQVRSVRAVSLAGKPLRVRVQLDAVEVSLLVRPAQGSIIRARRASGGIEGEMNTYELRVDRLEGGLSGEGTVVVSYNYQYPPVVTGSHSFRGTLSGTLQLDGAALPQARLVVRPGEHASVAAASELGPVRVMALGSLRLQGALRTGDLAVEPGAELDVEAAGSLDVRGFATIHDLNWHETGSLPLEQGGELVVLHNDGNDPVLGARPRDGEGYHTPSGCFYRFTYSGGDGNDVAWRCEWVPPRPGDLNGDRRSDILWHHAATGEVHRMFGSGLQTFGGKTVFREADVHWRVVGQGDMNGDKVADLLWRHEVNGHVYVMPLGSDGEVRAGGVVHVEADPSWHVAAVADVDGDRRDDILWWNEVTGELRVLLLDGLAAKASHRLYLEPDTRWRIVAVGSEYGFPVLFWRHAESGDVFRMYVGPWQGALVAAGYMAYREPDPAWKLIGAPDLDGDGLLDLVWWNSVTGVVHGMLRHAGSGFYSAQGPIHQAHTAWRVVAFGDYNGDGKGDLLWHNQSDGRVYVMLMNGLDAYPTWQGQIHQEPDLRWRIIGPAHFQEVAGR